MQRAAPHVGWHSFESDHPLVRYTPVRWTPRQRPEASRGQYHRSENGGAAHFTFEGQGLRLRYVAAQNMGHFEIVVDGQVLDTVDAYSPDLRFPATRAYALGPGPHQLAIRATGQRHPASSGVTVGLDAIQIFRADPNTQIVAPRASATATSTPHPVAGIDLVAAPAAVQPSPTPAPAALVELRLVIAYDENGNGAVDVAEGVGGIPVRLVAASSNQVLAQSLTDAHGSVALALKTTSDLRLVVPYFGAVWELPASRGNTTETFTLLLDAGNQPGIIP